MDLFEYWTDYPPTHEIQAAKVGYKKRAPLHFWNGEQIDQIHTENGNIRELQAVPGVRTQLPPSIESNPELKAIWLNRKHLKREPPK